MAKQSIRIIESLLWIAITHTGNLAHCCCRACEKWSTESLGVLPKPVSLVSGNTRTRVMIQIVVSGLLAPCDVILCPWTSPGWKQIIPWALESRVPFSEHPGVR